MTISRIHGRQVRTGTLSQAHVDTAFQAFLADMQGSIQTIYDTMSTDQERIDAIAAVTQAWGAADSDLQAAVGLLVNAAKAGAGLEANGSFVPPELSNYIGDATSLKGAVVALDTELKALADAVAAHAATLQIHSTKIGALEAADEAAALRMDGIDDAVAANAQAAQANADAIAAIQGGTSAMVFGASVSVVPSNAIDGTNKEFSVANYIIEGSESIYLNGVLLESGADYAITDATLVNGVNGFMNIELTEAPFAGDRLRLKGIKA